MVFKSKVYDRDEKHGRSARCQRSNRCGQREGTLPTVRSADIADSRRCLADVTLRDEGSSMCSDGTYPWFHEHGKPRFVAPSGAPARARWAKLRWAAPVLGNPDLAEAQETLRLVVGVRPPAVDWVSRSLGRLGQRLFFLGTIPAPPIL